MTYQSMAIRYDGTFTGLLSAFYNCYYNQHAVSAISAGSGIPQLHTAAQYLATDKEHADRVRQSIINRTSKAVVAQLYHVFLSEVHDREMLIFSYLSALFKVLVAPNFDLQEVNWRITLLNDLITREVSRMERMVCFQPTDKAIAFAAIDPDFDVLPLLGSYFTKQYPNQEWVIYDTARTYGIHFNQKQLCEVSLDFVEEAAPGQLPRVVEPTEGQAFQQLWKEYLNSPDNPSAKNMKLHIRHAPRSQGSMALCVA